MDFHPPQGAHTSYLRTLSKIIGLRIFFDPRLRTFRPRWAVHLTSFFVSVNTPKRSFFASRHPAISPSVALFASPFQASRRRGAHLTSDSRSVNPCATTFSLGRHRGGDAVSQLAEWVSSEGPRILQPIVVSSSPGSW